MPFLYSLHSVVIVIVFMIRWVGFRLDKCIIIITTENMDHIK